VLQGLRADAGPAQQVKRVGSTVAARQQVPITLLFRHFQSLVWSAGILCTDLAHACVRVWCPGCSCAPGARSAVESVLPVGQELAVAAGYGGAALPLWEAFARHCAASPAVADLVRALPGALQLPRSHNLAGCAATGGGSSVWLCSSLQAGERAAELQENWVHCREQTESSALQCKHLCKNLSGSGACLLCILLPCAQVPVWTGPGSSGEPVPAAQRAAQAVPAPLHCDPRALGPGAASGRVSAPGAAGRALPPRVADAGGRVRNVCAPRGRRWGRGSAGGAGAGVLGGAHLRGPCRRACAGAAAPCAPAGRRPRHRARALAAGR